MTHFERGQPCLALYDDGFYYPATYHRERSTGAHRVDWADGTGRGETSSVAEITAEQAEAAGLEIASNVHTFRNIAQNVRTKHGVLGETKGKYVHEGHHIDVEHIDSGPKTDAAKATAAAELNKNGFKHKHSYSYKQKGFGGMTTHSLYEHPESNKHVLMVTYHHSRGHYGKLALHRGIGVKNTDEILAH